MRQIPRPDYEYEIARLVRVYGRGMRDILTELQRMDISNITRATMLVTLREVAKILTEIDEQSAVWVNRNIPRSVLDGVAGTLYTLKLADTLEQAHTIAKFNRMNKSLVDAMIVDTQRDLLAITRNVSYRVRTTIQRVTAEVMRENFATGVMGRKTINRETLTKLRDKLGDAIDTGIIDRAGRRWRPETYVDMVTRTKTMRAQIEGATNEAVARGVLYGVISRHGATDACRNWEGRIVKFVSSAPGDYPTVEQAEATGEIWHPNCRHVVIPIRNPETVTE